MPINWSPLMVSEAMDMVEKYVNQAVEPLEQARLVAREALRIPDMPQYVGQHFMRLVDEVNRATGGGRWKPEGRLGLAVKSIRESLPDGAVEAERKRLGNGRQLSLVA